MKKLVIREIGGHYHLENFGPSFAGGDGKQEFDLVIESKSRGLYLEFPEATVHDLFTRFDLADPAFLRGAFRCEDFLRVKEEGDEVVVEARTGSLYDFFLERTGTGRCLMRFSKPVSFYWQGHGETHVA
jgi:hypothetical protein